MFDRVALDCVNVHDCVTLGFELTSMHTPAGAVIVHDCAAAEFELAAAGRQTNCVLLAAVVCRIARSTSRCAAGVSLRTLPCRLTPAVWWWRTTVVPALAADARPAAAPNVAAATTSARIPTNGTRIPFRIASSLPEWDAAGRPRPRSPERSLHHTR